MKSDDLTDKSFAFSIRIIALADFLVENKQFTISNQVLRSGTSIGANISESKQAESRKDFIHKLCIANKEASETEYWLKLLKQSGKLTVAQADSLIADCNSLQRMLVRSIRTLKSRINR